MRCLSIDIETFSDVDIKKGVYRYVDTPLFEILLFAYAFDGEEVQIVDLASGEQIPDEVLEALTNKNIIKRAYNAQFERVCLGKYLNKRLDPSQWQCTMVHAAYMALPGKLGKVAESLLLEEQKDKAGTLLINYFSKPCKPTRSNNQRTRNYPGHDMDKWQAFRSYCVQDVVTERAIANYLSKYPIPANERLLYAIDQDINDYGIDVDTKLVKSVINYYATHAEALLEESKKATGLDNPNSRDQLLTWLQENGVAIDDVRKSTLEALLDGALDDNVREVIENRLETGSASVKKYEAMLNATCSDGRVHGTLLFYGANRTGRWAGRLIQPQNMTKNYLKEIDSIRTLVRNEEYDTLECLYDSISDLFKQLIRTTLVASEGTTFAVADYSGIEARVIAWLADEKWAIEVFAKDGDIYKQTAANMFNLKYEDIDKPLRQRGKVAVLALGYQGGTGALKAMGALNMGIAEDELQGLVNAWRKANPHIVKLWKDVEARARYTIEKGKKVVLHHGIAFERDKDFMLITLPSGRKLSYFKPRIKEGKITYYGKAGNTNAYKEIDTHGGKLVENIIQAIARDCLAEALIKIHSNGYNTTFHVHDEVVVEVPTENQEQHLKVIQKLMGSKLSWANDLYLSSAGYLTPYYLKD